MATKTIRVDDDVMSTFDRTAAELGLTSNAVFNVFIRQFNACGGFPFEVRVRSLLDNPNLIRARMGEDGVAIMPPEWRDEDDDDEWA